MSKPKIFFAVTQDGQLASSAAALESAGYETEGAVCPDLAPLSAYARAQGKGLPACDCESETAEFCRHLLEGMQDIVLLLNREGRIEVVYGNLFFLTGRENDTYQGQLLATQVHQDDAGKIVTALTALAENPVKHPYFELRLQHRDGNWHWFDVHCAFIESLKSHGGYLFQFRDITLKKVTGHALFKREEQYRMIAESLKNEIIMVDPEGRVLYMNEAAAAPMGGRPFVFFNRTLYEIFPQSRADECMAGVKEVLSSGKNKFCKFTVPVGCTKLYFLLDFQPVFNEEGAVTSVLMMNTDITSLKLAEDSYLHVETGLQRLFSAPPGLFRTQAGRLVEANPALLSLLGYDSMCALAQAAPAFPFDLLPDPSVLRLPGKVGDEVFVKVAFRSAKKESLPVLLRVRLNRDPEGREFIDGLVEDLRGRNISCGEL